MTDLVVNGSKVSLIPVIKGLDSDGEMVSRLIADGGFDCVGVSISPEELEGLRAKDDALDVPMSPLEEAYAALLSGFGKVSFPPPCYTQAVNAADRHNIKVQALDMDDITYTDAYCDHVGVRDMIRLSLRTRRILRTRFDVSDKVSFVLDWDRRVNGAKGFRVLEMEREEHIAEGIRALCDRHSGVLAVVELERYNGIMAHLNG